MMRNWSWLLISVAVSAQAEPPRQLEIVFTMSRNGSAMAEVVERLECGHRGGVDEDVAPAVPVQHQLGGSAHVVRLAQVDDDVAGAIEADDRVVPCQASTDRPADRARASGHHRHA